MGKVVEKELEYLPLSDKIDYDSALTLDEAIYQQKYNRCLKCFISRLYSFNHLW